MTGWTEERRKKQAETIKRCKPWEKSTGPKSLKGKQKASMNAFKHGGRSRSIKAIKKVLADNRSFLKHYREFVLYEALEMSIANELLKDRAKSKARGVKLKNE